MGDITEADLDDAFAGGMDAAAYNMKEAATQAINEIRRGAYVDAITTLEREFLPKWADKVECDAQYKLELR